MDREETLKLTIKSLLEVVQTGAKNIEIAIMTPGKKLEMLPVDPSTLVEGSIARDPHDFGSCNIQRGLLGLEPDSIARGVRPFVRPFKRSSASHLWLGPVVLERADTTTCLCRRALNADPIQYRRLFPIAAEEQHHHGQSRDASSPPICCHP